MKNTAFDALKRDRTRPAARLTALITAVLVLITAMCGAFTACNGDIHSSSSDPSAPPGSAAADGEPSPTPDSLTETAQPVPAPGGALIMPMPENLSVNNPNYNPLLVYTEEALQLFSLVFDTLVAVDESNMLTPCLAQSWYKDPSDDNAWVFTLRKEAKWHSGEELRADDVIYTCSVLNSLGMESYYASSLESIDRVEKLDDLTVRFYMTTPGMAALYSLNFPIIKENAAPMTGTGAYRVDEIEDEKISLSANPHWWDRPPYIGSIRFLARANNDTALASYVAGQLNFVPTAQLTVGRYSEPGETVVKDIMTQNMEVLLVNHRRSVMNKPDLRRAIIHAINRSRIITNVYMNRARTSDVPVPPDSWLYDNSAARFDYNPQTAASLLDGIGYTAGADGSRGLTLTMLTSSTTENTTRYEAAQLIAAQLAEVGITVEIVTAGHNVGEANSEFIQALTGGDWDIALVGFNLNQNNDLSRYLMQDGANNYGYFIGGSSILDPMAAMAAAADEESLRESAYTLQSAFLEELPFIVLYFRLNSVVCSAEIKGIEDMREPAIMRNVKNWYFYTE